MRWPPTVPRGAPRLGLGLAALGRPAYIDLGRDRDLGEDRSVPALHQRADSLLDFAYGAGIRYFDAARSYGRAESFLGEWLETRKIPEAGVTVGSKWGYTYVGGWQMDAVRQEVQDLSLDAFRRQLSESRALLGRCLSLYQVHSATEANAVLYDEAVLAGLRELRASGLAVGVTTTGPHQPDTIERAIELGFFDSVQSTWNLLEPSSGAALARAHGAGLTVIVKEALANGRLTSSGDEPAYLAVAAARGVPPDTLALAAALANPWADLVLSGAVTTGQLQSHLGAEGVADDALVGLADGFALPPDLYWQERAQLPWD
jgi:aryl-alcohol dehydrogenase-like predicted oxidoreductase